MENREVPKEESTAVEPMENREVPKEEPTVVERMENREVPKEEPTVVEPMAWAMELENTPVAAESNRLGGRSRCSRWCQRSTSCTGS